MKPFFSPHVGFQESIFFFVTGEARDSPGKSLAADAQPPVTWRFENPLWDEVTQTQVVGYTNYMIIDEYIYIYIYIMYNIT